MGNKVKMTPALSPTLYRQICPTFIENWPASIAALSVPQVRVPLDRIDVMLFTRSVDRSESEFIFSCLVQRIDSAILKLAAAAMVRTGVRSPKDALTSISHLKITNGAAALSLLLCSRRVRTDVEMQLRFDDLPNVYVRLWRSWSPCLEFRCFMKHRRLVGVSPYFPKLAQTTPLVPEQIAESISQFFVRFRRSSHLDDVIFDVALTKSETQHGFDVELIEINPFCSLTDPCLYTWTDVGGFDGCLRIGVERFPLPNAN